MPGKIVIDLAPSEGNPRNSEGAMIRLSDGRILYAYSRYCGDSNDDHAPGDIWGIVSSDEGDTWEELGIIVDHNDYSSQNVMSVSLMKMQDGSTGIFYLVKWGPHDLRTMFKRSYDCGQTWTEPVCCMPYSGYFVVNNDRVVRLSDGSIMIPAALHRTLYGPNGPIGNDGRGEVHFFVSHDDGFTWSENPCIVVMPHLRHSHSGLQEPGIIELSPGNLWCWARTDRGYQYETFSLDGGLTWSPAEPSAFSSPCSPMTVKRMPDGRLLAIWNPKPNYNGRDADGHIDLNAGRTPLVCALSSDNGKTFNTARPLVLENDLQAGFCYISAFFTWDDSVLLSYCAGGPEDGGCLSRARIRKIALSELDVPSNNDEPKLHLWHQL